MRADPMYAVPYMSTPSIGNNFQISPSPFPQPKRTTVLVDSRDRDYTKYSGSTDFVVDLPETLHNVSSAMLITAEVPLTYYVHSAARGTSSMVVTFEGNTQTITVPDGTYNVSTILTALKSQLDTTFSSTFTVTCNEYTRKVTIAGTGTIAVDTTGVTKTADWGLAYYLGFPPNAVTSGTNTITGTRPAVLTPDMYLVVDVPELGSVLTTNKQSSRQTFAKIPLTGDLSSIQSAYFGNNASGAIQSWNLNQTASQLVNPKNRLDKLTVSLRFYDGTLVDLNGREWSMTLEFVSTRARE